MSQRHLKQLLWSSGALACLGAIALAAWAARPSSGARGPSQRSTEATRTTDSGQRTAPLEAYAAAWSLPLRRPLYDPPPAAPPSPPPPPPPPAPLNVRLVGTILEPGRPVGMFIGPAGKLEMLTVSETAGGAQILSIDLENATLLHQGTEVTLTIAKENR